MIQPSKRVDSNGVLRDMDNAYEEGIYAAVIGLEIVENPYTPDDKLNRKLWLKGFIGVTNGTIKSGGAVCR